MAYYSNMQKSVTCNRRPIRRQSDRRQPEGSVVTTGNFLLLHMYILQVLRKHSPTQYVLFLLQNLLFRPTVVGIEKQTYKISFMPKASVGLLSSTNIYKQSPWESFYSYRGTNRILGY